ncbi:MAG: hypothetical protein M3Q79_00020 [bacterium]|nr:hypothetical protein [bacterium]
MIEAHQARPAELFLVEGDVHPDVTSLFLRANESVRQELIGTVDIIRDAVAEYEEELGESTSSGHVRSAVVFKASPAIVKAYPKLYEDFLFMWFREELTAHTSDELSQIGAELSGIATGDIELTDAEQQQLSNLSDADMHQYLRCFGIEANDLAFPLLDVGTGKHAYFAHDVLKAFPGQRMVSTSMHLLSPNSGMSKALSGLTDRGELVGGNGMDLPFEDESFGMVVSLNADPYYVPKKDLLVSLREKQRVLRVGATALLCPAVCDYGEHDITEEDIAPLQGNMDISLLPIPESGYQFYRKDTRQMLAIHK